MIESLAFPNFSLFLVTVEMIECSFFDPIVDEYFNIFYLAPPRKNGVKIRNPWENLTSYKFVLFHLFSP